MLVKNSTVFQQRSAIHLLRKIWHSTTGAIGIALFIHYNMNPTFLGISLLGLSMMTFIFEWIRIENVMLNQVFCRLARPLMRDTEVNGPTGFAFYALGVGLALLFFDKNIALLATCYLVFADPSASFVGAKFGKTKIWHGRSLEGTLAFFAVALILNFIFYQQGIFLEVKNYIAFSITTAVFAALAEVVCHGKYLDDNLVIPVASGAIITLSQFIF